MILLVNSSLSFFPITSQRQFYNCKTQLCRGRTQGCFVFFQTKIHKITVQEHSFGEFAIAPLIFGMCNSPTDFFPSPTTFHLCPFLSVSPSTSAAFVRYTIYNASNSISTSLIILAEEGVPIFNSHIR